MTTPLLRILTVEDNRGDAALLRETLQNIEPGAFELNEVDRVEKALDWLQREIFDVILLDLMLPDSQGLATLELVQRAVKETPLIIMTGVEDEELAVRAIRRGAQDYLVKGRTDGRGIARAIRYAVDRKKIEEVLRKTHNELEQRVRERTAQLKTANQEMETFCYSMAHEFPSPLRSIEGFSQIILEEAGNRLDEVHRHYLERIQAAARKMAQLLDDQLTLSRLTRMEMKKEKVNISLLAEDVVQEIRARTPSRNVEVTISRGLEVMGDPKLLRIVLSNLFENAWKFTCQRPTARIEFGALSLTEQARRFPHTDLNQRVFFVRDNGVGFAMAYVNKLFLPFSRLHSEEEFAGLGIGLTMVKRIIQRHGGQVWAEGEVEKGATFYFGNVDKGEDVN